MNRLRKLLGPLVLLASLTPLQALPIFSGSCSLGGFPVVTNGVNSTTKVVQSFPRCTVEVFNSDTGERATIFTASGAPLANPFTANQFGEWQFSADGSQFDIRISGGGPPALPQPYTFTRVSSISVPITAGQISGVNASSILGLINADQIGSVNANTITGTINAGQIGSVNASSIVGTINSTQIGSVAASTITGSITAGQISSVSTMSFVGSITADQISSLTAAQITGVIVSSQLADQIIDTLGKYAQALRPVPILDTPPALPSADYLAGTYFYLTTTGHFNKVDPGGTTFSDAGTNPDTLTGTLKMYHIGELNAQNITGLIIASQIGSVNASTIAGTITASQISSVSASSITGTLNAGQISSVNASSITGSITASQIGSVNASAITGSITSGQIASVNASTITGVLTASQIGSINAATITIGLIQDGQINSVAAGKITAGTINGVTITGSTINSVSGSGTITLANGQLTSSATAGNSVILEDGGLFFTGTGFVSATIQPGTSTWTGLGGLVSFTAASDGFLTVRGATGLIGNIRLQEGASDRVKLGYSSSSGYVQFNNSANYALWTNATPKKIVTGSGTFTAGVTTISTGMTAVDSIVVTLSNASGPPGEYVATSLPTGGSFDVYSSDTGSTSFFYWIAYGTP